VSAGLAQPSLARAHQPLRVGGGGLGRTPRSRSEAKHGTHEAAKTGPLLSPARASAAPRVPGPEPRVPGPAPCVPRPAPCVPGAGAGRPTR